MSTVQTVSRNQSLSIAGRPGMIIRIAQGRVWLTRDGDIRDYVLSAGESMLLDGSGKVVVFGLTDGFLQVDKPERAPGVWTGLLARLTWMGEQA